MRGGRRGGAGRPRGAKNMRTREVEAAMKVVADEFAEAASRQRNCPMRSIPGVGPWGQRVISPVRRPNPSISRSTCSISRSHQEYVVAWGMAQRYLHPNESVVANLR